MRYFAQDLRGRSDAELAALLLDRPDLARPAPADVTTLASRATTTASLTRALDDCAGRGFLHPAEVPWLARISARRFARRYAERAEAAARLLRVADNLVDDHAARPGTTGHAAMLAILWLMTAKPSIALS